jgi:hypothetical protein
MTKQAVDSFVGSLFLVANRSKSLICIGFGVRGSCGSRRAGHIYTTPI